MKIAPGSSIDPELAAVQAELKAAGAAAPDIFALPLPEARAQLDRHYAHLADKAPIMRHSVDLSIPFGDTTLRARLHRPTDARSDSLLVYLHGGGWAFGTLDTHDHIMRMLAVESGLPLLGLEYSLAPERKYPHQVREIGAAFDWLGRHADELGCDPGRIVLVGDSAGANLAVAAALHGLSNAARGAVKGLVLLYGVYSADTAKSSWHALGDGRFGLSVAAMRWYWDQYVAEERQTLNGRVAPLAGSLAGSPPAWIGVGELDPLLDDSVDLSAALTAAAVPNELRVYSGLTHGFIRFGGRVPAVRGAIRDAAVAARKLAEGAFAGRQNALKRAE